MVLAGWRDWDDMAVTLPPRLAGARLFVLADRLTQRSVRRDRATHDYVCRCGLPQPGWMMCAAGGHQALIGWGEQISEVPATRRCRPRHDGGQTRPRQSRSALLLSAVHSLFRALKQERVIFRDPTRGISRSAMKRLPVPIPASQLRGLIDRASSPQPWFL